MCILIIFFFHNFLSCMDKNLALIRIYVLFFFRIRINVLESIIICFIGQIMQRILLQYEMKEHGIHTNQIVSVKKNYWHTERIRICILFRIRIQFFFFYPNSKAKTWNMYALAYCWIVTSLAPSSRFENIFLT